ncbi:T9SS type A sorting domain-containing protein [Rubrivirga sp.]|uniref:T9SS type A sorting domain-containing protein n=1 Tax=Rubrivirga sp. TaxID=1885344 RepID=UPI003C73CDFD
MLFWRQLAVLFLLATTPLASAQVAGWEFTGGPYASLESSSFDYEIQIAVQSDGSVLAAIGGRGVYRSRDGEEAWSMVQSGGTRFPALVSGSSGRVLVTTASPMRPTPFPDLYRSFDHGTSWEQLNPTPHRFRLVEAGPQDRLIAAGYGDELYSSIDWGATWSEFPRTMPWSGQPDDIGIPRDQALLVVVDRVLYRSRDDGATWQRVLEDGNAEVFEIEVAPSGTVYATTSQGVFTSVDAGQSWNLAGTSSEETSSLTVAGDGTLYAGVADGVRLSSDGGATWRALGEDAPFSDPSAIALAPGGRVLAVSSLRAEGDRIALFGFDAESTQWSRSGVERAKVVDMALSDRRVLAATEREGVFRNDLDRSWRDLEAPAASRLAEGPDGALVAARRDEVWRSRDGGDRWRPISAGVPSGANITSISLAPDGSLYLGTSSDGVFALSVGSAAWRYVGLQGVSVPAVFVANDGTLYASVGYGALLRSENGGTEWTPTDLEDDTVSMFAQDTDGVLWAVSGGAVFSSSGGTMWEESSPDIGTPYALVPAPQGGLYAGTSKGLVYKPPGSDWRQLETPAESAVFAIVATPESRLYIGTDEGVYRSQRLSTQSGSVPRPTALSVSAYPNPSHGLLTLAIDLDEAGDVRIDLFDVLGRQVRSTLSGTTLVGMHRVQIDGTGLPSGAYRYRVHVGRRVQTGTVIFQ